MSDFMSSRRGQSSRWSLHIALYQTKFNLICIHPIFLTSRMQIRSFEIVYTFEIRIFFLDRLPYPG